MASEADDLLDILNEDKRTVGIKSVKVDTSAETGPAELRVESNNDNLTKIVQAREQIAEVKKNLSTIVDSIANNPSLITRASDAWGAWPTWQKVGTGIVLTVPALLVGVATSVGSLLIIGGATGIAYTTTGLVLEDHHTCNVNIKQRLKDGILSLADVLEFTIVALDTIRLQLAEEIGKFKEENAKLVLQVSTLQDQIHTLSIQVGILVETESFLRTTKEKLQLEAQDLRTATEDQSKLLKRNQEELEAITKAYQTTQENLTGKVKELRIVREQVASEIAKTKQVSESLQKAVTTLSGVLIDDQKQREAFQAKLTKLLDGEEASALKVVERLSTTQGELEGATTDLRSNNEHHKELLVKQESLIKRLELLDLQSMVVTAKETRTSVVGHSIFANPITTTGGDIQVAVAAKL